MNRTSIPAHPLVPRRTHAHTGDIPKNKKFRQRFPCQRIHQGLCIQADAKEWIKLSSSRARLEEFAFNKEAAKWLRVVVCGQKQTRKGLKEGSCSFHFFVAFRRKVGKLLIFAALDQHNRGRRATLEFRRRELALANDGFVFHAAGGVVKHCFDNCGFEQVRLQRFTTATVGATGWVPTPHRQRGGNRPFAYIGVVVRFLSPEGY